MSLYVLSEFPANPGLFFNIDLVDISLLVIDLLLIYLTKCQQLCQVDVSKLVAFSRQATSDWRPVFNSLQKLYSSLALLLYMDLYRLPTHYCSKNQKKLYPNPEYPYLSLDQLEEVRLAPKTGGKE